MDRLGYRLGVFVFVSCCPVAAANCYRYLLEVPLRRSQSKKIRLQGHYWIGSRSPRCMGWNRKGIHHRYPLIVLLKIHLRTLQNVELGGLPGRV